METQIRKLSPGMKIAGSIVITLFVLLLFRGKAKTPVELNARVNFSDSILSVTNLDRFDWSNIRITMNSEYKRHLASLPAGVRMELNPQEFVDQHNRRFQPFSQKTNSVVLSADTPHGRGHYVGHW